MGVAAFAVVIDAILRAQGVLAVAVDSRPTAAQARNHRRSVAGGLDVTSVKADSGSGSGSFSQMARAAFNSSSTRSSIAFSSVSSAQPSFNNRATYRSTGSFFSQAAISSGGWYR